MKAYIDFETFSELDLSKAGAHAYAESDKTGIYTLGYALENGAVHSWRPGLAFPEDLAEWVGAGKPVVAHNAAFEFEIWNQTLAKYCPGVPRLKIEQLDDTMARALALALPAKLGDLAKVMGLAVEKDAAGHRLMLLMCKPNPRALKKGTVEYYSDQSRLLRLEEYCRTDVEVERQIDRLLPPLTPAERRIWELDHAINSRGVLLDLPAIRGAQEVIAEEISARNSELKKLTEGAVNKVSSAKAILEWLCSRGVDAADLTKATVTKLLDATSEGSAERRVLEIRQEAGKASVAKYKAMEAAVSKDGRARGLLAYGGAGRTLRWAGRRVQPQNFTRPEIDQEDIDGLIDCLGQPFARDAIELVYGPPVTRLADCLRGMLIAAPGHEFIAADLANIEGRFAAWCAGEGWKIQAFVDFDAGTGPDLYKVSYGRAFGIDPSLVDKIQRQIGKVMELALQYQGGFGAFETMAAGYDVTVVPDEVSPPRNAKFVLKASEVRNIVSAWRDAHPNFCCTWRDLETCAIWACRNPGESCQTRNGKVRFVRLKRFLFAVLPSGRALAYFSAHVGEKPDASGHMRAALRYEGMNSYTHKWDVIDTYGGKLFENIVQAGSRDILANGLLEAEAAGMPVVLHVHDEIVTEPMAGAFSVLDLERAMCTLPPWANGLPVAASGWVGRRYQK